MIITKYSVVLSRSTDDENDLDELFVEDEHDEPFTEDSSIGTWLYVPKNAWKELGSPEQITVTIVPGDTLNEEVTDV